MKIVAIAIALTTAACSKVQAPPPPRAPMPAEVVAILTVPSYDATAPGYYAFIDAVKPGEGAALRAMADEGIAEELDRSALDWARPMHLVVVAPPAGGAPDLVLVAAVRDAGKLSKRRHADRVARVSGAWAAIGPPRAVEQTWRWALGTLATSAVPTTSHITVFPAAIRAHWGAALEAELDPDDSQAKALARDAVLGLLDQTQQVAIDAELARGVVTLDLAITPRAGTLLAAWFAAQKPSSFTVFEHLPLETPLGTMAMHMSLGPFAEPVRTLIWNTLRTELGELGPRTAALLETIWSLSTGEYAGVTVGTTGTVVNAIGINDPAKARAEIDVMAKALSEVKLPDGVHIVIDTQTHADVPIRIGKLVADGESVVVSIGWAAWDTTLAIAMNDLDGAALASAIDRSRSKPAVPASMAKVIADGRSRGDCLLWTVDMVPGEQPPFTITFGVRDGVGHISAELPGDQLGTIIRSVPADE